MPKHLERLLQVVTKLNTLNAPPWSQGRSLHSMSSVLLDACTTCIHAIESAEDVTSPNSTVTEGLGDLLFNLLMMIQAGADEHNLDLNQVCHHITEKMIKQHPNLFTHAFAEQKTKQNTRHSTMSPCTSLLDGIPLDIPALAVASLQGDRAASVGFDWPSINPVISKVEEEWDELMEAIENRDPKAIEHELGDTLMSLAFIMIVQEID